MGMSKFFFFSCFSDHLLSYREARILFKAGKNRDGWFGSEDLIAQVDRAIDIFEGLTQGYAQGLFLFDNAPSHQKRALDAISARKMSKGVFLIQDCPLMLMARAQGLKSALPMHHACAMAHS